MLILVRHGQTDANAAGLLQGRADKPLNTRGKGQARAVAVALRTLVGEGALVVSSPLARCRQTAAAILVSAGRDESELVIDPAWVELDYGSWDLRPLRDVPADQWSQWRKDLHFAPPGGESLLTLRARVETACDGLLEDAAAGTIVVVSHVSPIKAAVAWALGVDDSTSWRMQLDPASICRVACGANGPSLRTFNETAHLHVPGAA